jgi:hypothetical protein
MARGWKINSQKVVLTNSGTLFIRQFETPKKTIIIVFLLLYKSNLVTYTPK